MRRAAGEADRKGGGSGYWPDGRRSLSLSVVLKLKPPPLRSFIVVRSPVHAHCARVCVSLEQRRLSRGRTKRRSPLQRRSDIPRTHKRTNHPCIRANRWSGCPARLWGTIRVRHAAPDSHATHCTRPRCSSLKAQCTDSFICLSTYLCPISPSKDEPDSPSLSHSCKVSKLRSLIIPSQGLSGLVMLCAKPGTSISAPKSR